MLLLLPLLWGREAIRNHLPGNGLCGRCLFSTWETDAGPSSSAEIGVFRKAACRLADEVHCHALAQSGSAGCKACCQHKTQVQGFLIFGPAVSKNITEPNANDQASVGVRWSWLALAVQICDRKAKSVSLGLVWYLPYRPLNSKTVNPPVAVLRGGGVCALLFGLDYWCQNWGTGSREGRRDNHPSYHLALRRTDQYLIPHIPNLIVTTQATIDFNWINHSGFQLPSLVPFCICN